jgi:hypothetical protein
MKEVKLPSEACFELACLQPFHMNALPGRRAFVISVEVRSQQPASLPSPLPHTARDMSASDARVLSAHMMHPTI